MFPAQIMLQQENNESMHTDKLFYTLWVYLQRGDIGPAPALHMASYELNPVETHTPQMRWPEEKDTALKSQTIT